MLFSTAFENTLLIFQVRCDLPPALKNKGKSRAAPLIPSPNRLPADVEAYIQQTGLRLKAHVWTCLIPEVGSTAEVTKMYFDQAVIVGKQWKISKSLALGLLTDWEPWYRRKGRKSGKTFPQDNTFPSAARPSRASASASGPHAKNYESFDAIINILPQLENDGPHRFQSLLKLTIFITAMSLTMLPSKSVDVDQRPPRNVKLLHILPGDTPQPLAEVIESYLTGLGASPEIDLEPFVVASKAVDNALPVALERGGMNAIELIIGGSLSTAKGGQEKAYLSSWSECRFLSMPQLNRPISMQRRASSEAESGEPTSPLDADSRTSRSSVFSDGDTPGLITPPLVQRESASGFGAIDTAPVILTEASTPHPSADMTDVGPRMKFKLNPQQRSWFGKLLL